MCLFLPVAPYLQRWGRSALVHARAPRPWGDGGQGAGIHDEVDVLVHAGRVGSGLLVAFGKATLFRHTCSCCVRKDCPVY